MVDLRNRIQTLIANNKIEMAIKELLAWAKAQQHEDLEQDLLLVHSKFHQVKRQENLGIIRFTDAMQQRAIISNSILDFLKRLEPEEIIIGSVPRDNTEVLQKTILFLASNPFQTAKLQLQKEYVQISGILQDHTDEFRLVAEWAVTPQKLLTAILKYRPNFVHFSGHGLGSAQNGKRASRPANFPKEVKEKDIGGIILEDAHGQPQWVKGIALKRLFETISKKIKIDIVILNACHSDEQAKAIVEHVPYVIGMNTAVDDNAAVEFSSGFYQGLSSDQDIEFAFEIARTMIQMQGHPDHDVPILYRKKNASG